jgi:hypothetical protein
MGDAVHILRNGCAIDVADSVKSGVLRPLQLVNSFIDSRNPMLLHWAPRCESISDPVIP